jgi:hypothetical protein
MNFLKSIAAMFTGSAHGFTGTFYPVSVKCNRCGEVIEGQINMNNDLSIEYNHMGETTGYTCRKVFMGSGRCFQQMEVTLTFNAKRALIDSDITGGRFVEDEPAS